MIDPPARPRPIRRAILRVGLVATLLVIGLVAWRMTSLLGLPDIGDPFDVEAFCRAEVRDEDNAFVLYRQAAAKLRNGPSQLTRDWSTASEAERSWLADNREALELWRQGTERPDAMLVRPEALDFWTDFTVIQAMRDFDRLAGLEGSRLIAAGDMAGAWRWYRANLRSSRHCGQRGTIIERLVGVAIMRTTVVRLNAWASRPEVDAAMLRTALAEVRSLDRMTAPLTESIKWEYVSFFRSIENPDLLRKALWERLDDMGPSPWRGPRVGWLRIMAAFRRDPERTRRLTRQVTANWLDHGDRPRSERPPLHLPSKIAFEAAVSPDRLTPAEMDDWAATTVLFDLLHPANWAYLRAVDRERADYAGLVLHLARELFRREQGRVSRTDEELVGRYLDALPDATMPPP